MKRVVLVEAMVARGTRWKSWDYKVRWELSSARTRGGGSYDKGGIDGKWRSCMREEYGETEAMAGRMAWGLQ